MEAQAERLRQEACSESGRGHERNERTYRVPHACAWIRRKEGLCSFAVVVVVVVVSTLLLGPFPGVCGENSDSSDSLDPNSTWSPFLLKKLHPHRRTSYYSLFPTPNNKQLNDLVEDNNQLESSSTNFQIRPGQNARLPQHIDLDKRSGDAEGRGRIIFPSSGPSPTRARPSRHSERERDVDRVITSFLDELPPSPPFRFPDDTLTPSGSSRSGRTLQVNSSASEQPNDKDDGPEHREGAPGETTLSPLYRPGPELLSPSLPLSSIASSVESSRKASPDVQDIIDGIVKLLGGKVKDAPAQNNNPVQQQQNPVQVQRPYNLFNPNKPLLLPQTPRPTRINNRGPVIANPNGNGQNLNSGEFQQQQLQQQQSSFEAIPLEAINNGFNLSQTKFGPPYPLSQIGQEAPYKQGVPLPEQIVPNFQQQQHHHNQGSNFNIPQPQSHGNGQQHSQSHFSSQKTPTEEYYGLPGYGEATPDAHIYHHVPSAGAGSGERDRNPASAERIGGGTKRPTSQTPTTLLVPTSSLENNGNANANFANFGHRDPSSSSSSQERLTTVNYHDKSTSSGTTTQTPAPAAAPAARPPGVGLQAQVQTDEIEDDEKDQQREEDEAQKEFQLQHMNEKQFYKPNSHHSHQHQHQHHEPQPQPAQFPSFNLGNAGAPSETKHAIKPSLASAANGQHHAMQMTTIEPTRATGTTMQATQLPSAAPTPSPTPATETAGNWPNWPVQDQGTTATTGSTRRPHHQHPPSQQPSYNHYNQQGTNYRNGFEPPAPSSPGSPATSSSTSAGTSTTDLSNNVVPTPPLRPGIVIHEGNPNTKPPPATIAVKGQGYGSVEVVTALDDLQLGPNRGQNVGDVFDVTVTAKQGFGVQPVTGQPFVTPVDLNDEIITAPNLNQQFVAIDGKRTYFNLQPVPHAVGSATPTELNDRLIPAAGAPHSQPKPFTLPPIRVTTQASTSTSVSSSVSQKAHSHSGTVGQPTHPFAPKTSNAAAASPSRAVSTSLSIHSDSGSRTTTGKVAPAPAPGSKAPPNIIRRPVSRKPSIPPVRIDTCIVGDDSTCNSEQSEVCRTESGVSSCICRPGYARRRHREPCRAIVALVMSIRLDKLGDKKLSYDPEYFNHNSEIYQNLEWETIHGIDAIVSETTLQPSYVGAKMDAIGFDGRFAVVNSTILMHDTNKMPAMQVKRELQRQFIQNLNKHRNNFGKTQLWVDEPVSAISAINDVDECENSELNDCDSKAKCINTFGSFECKCEPGYGDLYEKDRRRGGKKCESCSGKLHCNGRGECLIENSQKVCKCASNYYGSQCDIDGEVMAVAIGASVSALIIIALTLACLCMWSRRWKREEQKAALMSRTLFGGMATQAMSYISSKNNMNGNPYQQHVGLEDRLRWAQVNDSSMAGNIYVQNEPLSLHASPTLLGASLMDTPPMMSTRRSSDTCDTTVDDLFEERHPTKRPKSRSSQMQQGGGGIYYDLDPDTDIYATRQPPTLVPFSQFCVPMNPYSHRSGFYN